MDRHAFVDPLRTPRGRPVARRSWRPATRPRVSDAFGGLAAPPSAPAEVPYLRGVALRPFGTCDGSDIGSGVNRTRANLNYR